MQAKVLRLIQQGNSELPEKHWIRSAAARYLGVMIWEEGYGLTGVAASELRQRELYLDAIKMTKAVHGLDLSEDAALQEVPKVANNLLYFALDYLQSGGNADNLAAAGFAESDINMWLQEMGANEPTRLPSVSTADTARRAFVYSRDHAKACAAAQRVLTLLPLSKADTMSRYHLKMRREAESTLSSLDCVEFGINAKT